MDEIIVHAQKRDQILTATPVSISVVGAEAIQDWNLTSLEDLQTTVPNLRTYSQFAYNNTLSLRGVGTFSRNIGFDERVGLYLDGLYLGPSYGLNQNLLDIEQVEVLRGPQGTFFGRNSIAGAVTLISKKPGDTLEAQAVARFGNLGNRTVQGLVEVPVADGVSFSLSGGLNRRDGLTTNIFDGSTLDNRNRNNVRGQLLYNPSDRFEAHLSLDRNELDERMLVGDPNSDTFGIFPDSGAPKAFEVDFNTSATQRVVTRGAGLTMHYRLPGGMRISSLTGLRSSSAAHSYDTDYTRADVLKVQYAEDYSHFSQELKLTSAPDSPIGYVFGMTFLDQKAETDRHAIGGADAYVVGIADGADMTNFGQVDTTAWGLYGNIDLPLNDRLDLSLGLRWSRDEKSVDWTVDTTAAPYFFLATGTLKDARHDTDLSPTISLTYKASDTLTAFIRHAQGFKAGGYNLDYVSAAIFPDQLEFRKESAKSYEAGIKGSHMGGKAQFSATLFWVDYKDYQVNQFLDLGGGNTVILISNAAKVRTKGAELEWHVRPTGVLDITASLALLDADYRQFDGGGVGGTDVSGNHLDAPTVEASILASYRTALSGTLELYTIAGFSYADGYYITPDNIKAQPLLGGGSVPFGFIDARHQLTLKAGVESPGGGWKLGLWVQNGLDDKGTASSLRDFFGTVVEAETVPRTYGVELGYNF